jgi:hypothetical protein
MLLSPLLSGCVSADELNLIVNETWMGWWSAKLEPSSFVTIAGLCISVIAVLIGVLIIWGLLKWVRGGELPVGLFLVLILLAGTPFYINVIKVFSDWLISGTPYGISYIFQQMGWGWPPSGDINFETLKTAAGLTVALPLISLGWEIFIVIPALLTALVTAAITRSTHPLWLGASVLGGWMATRPVHYIVVSIIGVNRPDGAVGAIVSTVVALNQWYMWGTLGMIGVLWIGFPAGVAIFLLVAWIIGRIRGSRKNRGSGTGGLIAGIPTGGDGDGEGEGENGANGNGTSRDQNGLGNAKNTRKSSGERGKSGERGESATDANGLGRKKPESKGKGESAKGEGAKGKGSQNVGGERDQDRTSLGTSGRYTRVRGKNARQETDGKVFIGWRNPDTKGIDYYPEGVDPNNLGGRGDHENARPGNPSARTKQGGGEVADAGRDSLGAKNAQEGPERGRDDLGASNTQDETGRDDVAGGVQSLKGDVDAQKSHREAMRAADSGGEERPETGHDLNRAVKDENSFGREVGQSGANDNLGGSLTQAPQQSPASSDKGKGESDHGQGLGEAGRDALIATGPVGSGIAVADQVLTDSGLSDLDTSRTVVRSMLERGNREARKAIGGEETDLNRHGL